MTNIINNPPANNEESGGLASVIIGIIILVIIGILFFVFVLPSMQNSDIPQDTTENSMDLNVTVPLEDSSSDTSN